jgi:hypothetical protein
MKHALFRVRSLLTRAIEKRRIRLGTGACLVVCSIASPTHAEDENKGAEPVQLEAESPLDESFDEEPENKGVTLGARGFGGVLFEGKEGGGLFGGAVLVGIPLVHRLELEASGALAKSRELPAFLVAECVLKWVFEKERALAPHVILGPLVSVDIEGEAAVSAGVIAAFGATYWTTRTFGLTGDLSYRLLAGSELAHAGTLALGVVLAPF